MYVMNKFKNIMSSKKKQLRLKLKSLSLQVTGSWGNSDFLLKFSSVQLLSCVRLFATPWIAAGQASLSITNSRSPPKPMSIESVMSSNHPILCHPLPLLPLIFPSIRVFSNDSALRMRWPKYWSSKLGKTFLKTKKACGAPVAGFQGLLPRTATETGFLKASDGRA